MEGLVSTGPTPSSFYCDPVPILAELESNDAVTFCQFAMFSWQYFTSVTIFQWARHVIAYILPTHTNTTIFNNRYRQKSIFFLFQNVKNKLFLYCWGHLSLTTIYTSYKAITNSSTITILCQYFKFLTFQWI